MDLIIDPIIDYVENPFILFSVSKIFWNKRLLNRITTMKITEKEAKSYDESQRIHGYIVDNRDDFYVVIDGLDKIDWLDGWFYNTYDEIERVNYYNLDEQGNAYSCSKMYILFDIQEIFLDFRTIFAMRE